MKNAKNTHLIIFFQCALCAILAAFCLTVRYRQSTAVSQVGSFGFAEQANDTFSHLARRLYNEAAHD